MGSSVSVGIWYSKGYELITSRRPLKLCGSWTVFGDPVKSLTCLDMPQAGTLQHTLFCTSAEGTIAVISLSEMEQ
jgi:hypothetical protein